MRRDSTEAPFAFLRRRYRGPWLWITTGGKDHFVGLRRRDRVTLAWKILTRKSGSEIRL